MKTTSKYSDFFLAHVLDRGPSSGRGRTSVRHVSEKYFSVFTGSFKIIVKYIAAVSAIPYFIKPSFNLNNDANFVNKLKLASAKNGILLWY